MKSIQTKLTALILGCVLLSSFIIGGASLINTQHAVDADAARIMNLVCSENANQLNAQFERIEQATNTFASYVVSQLDSVESLKNDPVYASEYVSRLVDVAVNSAANTAGAIGVYMRLNPELTTATDGLFWCKSNQDGNYYPEPTTDITLYTPADFEYVGWYYTPIHEQRPVWLSPYQNKNVNIQMISYVIPIYKDGETIGVVGMDIDYNLVTEIVASMAAYETGYAFLSDSEGNVMYHSTLPFGVPMASADSSLLPVVNELSLGSSANHLFTYNWHGTKKRMAFRSLTNGMRLALTAPVSEIDGEKNQLVLQLSLATFLISVTAAFVAIVFSRRIVHPLRELNAAAKKIADGDLSISITHYTNDEVGDLATSFCQTASHLKQYIDYINGLAYRDALTGLQNKTAYQDAVKKLDERATFECFHYAIAVFDLNDLKHTNDNFGHERGDELIAEAAHLLNTVFKRSPVFRIGGDEFAAILEGIDYQCSAQLFAELESLMATRNQNAESLHQVLIAHGIASYNPSTDTSCASVFQRADTAMYCNKAQMKAKCAPK